MRNELNEHTPKEELFKELHGLRDEVARLRKLTPRDPGAVLYQPMLDALDYLNEGILILDRDGRILYANPAVEKMLFQKDLPGKSIYDVYPSHYGKSILKNYNIALTERKAIRSVEYIQPLKSWYNIKIMPFEDHTVVVFYDKSPYERLKELYRLTRYTMDNAMEYIIWVNENGTLSYVNDYVRRSLGYEGNATANYTIADIIIDPPAREWSSFWTSVQNDLSISFESRIKSVHDKTFPGEVTANYVAFKNDEYLVFFIRDISVRKLYLDELNAARAQAELYLDLMCHDINNMNQVGMGFLELAMESEDTGAASKELLAKTQESFEKSTDLINNVKKLQSSKSGALRLRPIDIGKIMESVIRSHLSAGARDIRINYDNCGRCEVLANDLVRDIFENIIGNAIKHSNGALVIDVGIEGAIMDGKEYCRIEIDDTGPGMPDNVKQAIFSRIDVNMRRASGKGLGLYLVKTLVEDFHGKIWAENRVPDDYRQGTRIVVMLPRS